MKKYLYLVFVLFCLGLYAQEEKIALRKGNVFAIKDVVFSPDGSRLLALSEDAAVLYRISDGMELARLESENFFNAYFTNDGKIVFINVHCFGKCFVSLYDLELKNKFADFEIMKKRTPSNSFEFCALDGNNIIAIVQDSLIQYCLTDGAVIARNYLKKDIINACLSDDMQLLAFAAAKDYNVYIYDIRKDIVVDTVPLGNEKFQALRSKIGSGIHFDSGSLEFILREKLISGIFCSKDEKTMNIISIHDLKTGKENIVEYKEGRESPCYFGMSSDASNALICDAIEGIKIISVPENHIRFEVKPKLNIRYNACVFSNDDKYVMARYDLLVDEETEEELSEDELNYIVVYDANNMDKVFEINSLINFYDVNTRTMAFAVDNKLSWVNLNKPDSIITVHTNVMIPRFTVVDSRLGLIAASYYDSTLIVFDIHKAEEKYRLKINFVADKIEFNDYNDYMIYYERSGDLFIANALTGKHVNRIFDVPTNVECITKKKQYFTDSGRLFYKHAKTKQETLYDIDKDIVLYQSEMSFERKYYELYNSDTLLFSYESSYKNLKVQNVFSSDTITYKVNLNVYINFFNFFRNEIIYQKTEDNGYMSYNLLTKQTEAYKLHPDIRYFADIDYKNKILYYITVDKEGFAKLMLHSAESNVLKFVYDLGYLNKENKDVVYGYNHLDINQDKNLLYFQFFDYEHSMTRFYFFNLTTFELIKKLEFNHFIYESVDFSDDYNSFILEVNKKIFYYDLLSDNCKLLYKKRDSEENHFEDSGIIAKKGYDAFKFYNVNDASETKTFIRFNDGTELIHNECYFKPLKGSLEGKLYYRNSGLIVPNSEIPKY
jgi:WD40 repeat protein